MNTLRPFPLCLLVLLAPLAACDGDPAGPGDAEQLVGSWERLIDTDDEQEHWELEFRDGDVFTAARLHATDPEEGAYDTDDGTLILQQQPGHPQCGDTEGRYDYDVIDTTLNLTPQQDDCAARAEVLDSQWDRRE